MALARNACSKKAELYTPGVITTTLGSLLLLLLLPPASGAIDIHESVGPSVPGPAGAWLDQGWYTSASGHRLSNGTVTQLLDKYAGTGPAWLTRRHDTFWVTYQPGGRYWDFQFALAGGTLLLALLLGAATIALIRYRRA